MIQYYKVSYLQNYQISIKSQQLFHVTLQANSKIYLEEQKLRKIIQVCYMETELTLQINGESIVKAFLQQDA